MSSNKQCNLVAEVVELGEWIENGLGVVVVGVVGIHGANGEWWTMRKDGSEERDAGVCNGRVVGDSREGIDVVTKRQRPETTVIGVKEDLLDETMICDSSCM